MILGGDVLKKNGGTHSYTGDNWSVDFIDNEAWSNYSIRSVKQTFKIIREFDESLQSNNIRYVLVIVDELENTVVVDEYHKQF
ncbi:hypothetical protein BOW53_16895 [Solemya pervernicosa gill symbiont]|uniref:Immunity protein 40 domain-containing protein n=1 Tax=Solemya pervernicosa gill symbiont TaxID=642797 RepID=A0A1T2KYP0_9GAMM|nr:hypothetical protein BOW53_16895 [Solemya pervernicosa gill symbiont]